MNIDLQVWWKDHYHELYKKEDGEMEYRPKWVLSDVKSLHLGTGKVIVGCRGGNRSIKIGNECILRHYAQVQDDEGIKLFTGDIVTAWFMLTEMSKPFRAVVEWDKYRFALRNLSSSDFRTTHPYQNADFFGMSVKRLGNKYENPELMNL